LWSLIVDAAEFVYELWRRRLPALVLDLLAARDLSLMARDLSRVARDLSLMARDLSLVTVRDSHGHTLRDRIFLDSFNYGAADVMKMSVLYVDEFVLNVVTTGKLSCLQRLAMAGYEHINGVGRVTASSGAYFPGVIVHPVATNTSTLSTDAVARLRRSPATLNCPPLLTSSTNLRNSK